MLLFGNEREIQQGEEWNLDIRVSQSNVEYIPFIISSERQNPMWAITVASTKYEKNERYVATWWLDLTDLPRFYQTVPQDLGEIAQGQPITRPAGDAPMQALYRYTKVGDKVDLELGHKPYYYVYFTEEDPNEPNHNYECVIRMQFQSEETANWGSQNYLYQITLVDTISMGDWINLAKESNPTLAWPEWVTRDNQDWTKPLQELEEDEQDYLDRVEESWREFRNGWILDNINVLFPFIKERLPNWFQPDIDIDAPVGRIDIPQVILAPTKLQVNNNLRRII